MRTMRYALIATAALATLAGVGVGTAHADPSSLPPLTGIVGVGAETSLFDQLATLYNSTSPASMMYNWDPVNPSNGAVHDPITTKGSGSFDTTCTVVRPAVSNDGLTLLGEERVDSGAICVDFAPVSRPLGGAFPSTFAFAEYAGDEVTWSSPAGTGGTPSPVPSTLTLAQLKAIYTCTDTNWAQVGGGNAPIVPVLPLQANPVWPGYGTRGTFLLALGGGTTPLTPGACVVNGSNSTGSIAESTGQSAANAAQFGTSSSPAVDDVFPYSIGDYIAQGPATSGVGGHATTYWGHGDLVLHAITNSSNVVEQPTTTNASGQPVINRSFPTQLEQLRYTAVLNGGTATVKAFPKSPAYDATGLPAIFGPTGTLCRNSSLIISYGFWTVGSSCGTLF